MVNQVSQKNVHFTLGHLFLNGHFFLGHPDNGDTSDFDYNVGDDRKLQRIIKCLTVQ